MYVGGFGPASIPLEIHWGVQDRFNLLRVNMNEIWSRVRPWSIGERSVLSMCPEDLLIYLCYHAEKHTCFSRYIADFSHIGPEIVLETTEAAQLLWYADILRLIHIEGHSVRWDTIAERCRRWGIGGQVYASLAVTDGVFGTSVAARPLGMLEPPRPRRLQAGLYRRLMKPRGRPRKATSLEDTARRRLFDSGAGLQFRPFRLLDITEYLFPDLDLVSRCYSVTGPKLFVRYICHTITAAFRVTSCLCLLAGSAIWRSIAPRLSS
jgi:hypothetical protein